MLTIFIISVVLFLLGCILVVVYVYCGEQYKRMIREFMHDNPQHEYYYSSLLESADEGFKKKLRLYDIWSCEWVFKLGTLLMTPSLLVALLSGVALWVIKQ